MNSPLSVIGPGLILALITAAGGAVARPASLQGRWRLDPRESEMAAGEAPPAELVMTITRDDSTAFCWTVTVRMADGQGGATRFAGAIDGKPYPVEGRPGSTSAFSWTRDGALKQVSESAGGIAVERCTFSADVRKMTCEGRQTDVTGRATGYVEAFDRLDP
jgi:hypothetical protein